MIKESYFTFPSADGKTNISAKYFVSDASAPVAVVQIVHGMLEFKERYDDFARYLAENGFFVCAHDHLGHGNSVTSVDDYGFIADDDPVGDLIVDMHTMRETIQTYFPKLPYFILGHSMGSYLLRMYMAIYSPGIAGVIVMGTGQQGAAAGKLAVALTKLIAKKKGWHYRSDFVQNLTYTSAYKRFDMTGKDLSNIWITRDVEKIKQYYGNPKCTFKFTLNGHLALFSAVAFDMKEKNTALIPADLPILVTSGSDDPVGDCSRGVEKFVDVLNKTGHTNVTKKLYPGARHEILNELNRDEVYDDLKNWLYGCLESGKSANTK